MKRILKITVVGVLLLIAAYLLSMFVVYPLAWKSRERKESIHVLETAQTEDELAHAVGRLGIFLTFPDDSWLAIRYRDTHQGTVICSAVAHDSGGAWFESSHHFCGRFMRYPDAVERQKEAEKEIEKLGETFTVDYLVGFEDIHHLATAPDLETARTHLVSLGFRQMEK